ncbi:GNAT family N-acetyltransferase [Mycobacterium sp. NPDC050441]|uniref:GNAT family N-acetyltransferase n=1 Tax=Mycobacterium sp. NPDC050441 TaxID=3155403 RepID=UPI0033C96503
MSTQQPVNRRIEALCREDSQTAADVLADAFYTDPVFSWLLPDAARRAEALRRYFAIAARDVVLRHPGSVAAVGPGGAQGAALILPPGHWRTPISVEARHAVAYARIFGRRLGHALGALTAIERAHPRFPHYYLPYIGVVTTARGQGVGSTLLSDLARRCDAEELPAYLEASSPDNARLYRRHGFVTLQQVRPLGAPPIELMVRQPAR